MKMREWLHLAGRFLQTLVSRPLDGAERAEVEGWLRTPEAELFFSQPAVDQRHGLTAARRVASTGVGREVVRAALLHDVGKRHARLGVMGRVVASLAIRLGLPIRGRWAAYRDHGPLGARDLEAAGAEPMVVAYAAAHHGPRPEEIPEAIWRLLDGADRVRGR